MKHFLQFVFGFAFLSFSVLTLGQSTVYKLQQPDGRTVYSDKVLPQIKVQKELSPQSELTVIAPLAASKEAQQTDARVGSRLARVDELWRERNLARAELDRLRRAKADGEEPMPGERAGTASGRSRLSETYWARQDLLQHDIDAAQRWLERAEQNLRAAGS